MNTVKRHAVIFNGQLNQLDGVAAWDRAYSLRLQKMFTETYGFDSVTVVDHECAGDGLFSEGILPGVTCIPIDDSKPLEAVERYVDTLNATHKPGETTYTFQFVQGHGSAATLYTPGMPIGKFANVINEINPEIQRVTIGHQCGSGGMDGLGMRDENDFLWTYAGAADLNFADQSALFVFSGEESDADGDGVIALREMFWRGRLTIQTGLSPYSRLFVFDMGPKFEDRGFGTTPAKRPFKPELIQVSTAEQYVDLMRKAGKQGITIAAFQGFDPPFKWDLNKHDRPIKVRLKRVDLEKKLSQLAIQHQGTVQFLYLPQSLAKKVLGNKDANKLRNGSFLRPLYIGADESLRLPPNTDVVDLIQKVKTGKALGKKSS